MSSDKSNNCLRQATGKSNVVTFFYGLFCQCHCVVNRLDGKAATTHHFWLRITYQ